MEDNLKKSKIEISEYAALKLGNELKKLRGERDKEKVARETGILSISIKNLEIGNVKKPNPYMIKILAHYYGVNPFKLYNFMGLYEDEEAEEYFKEIFVEEGFLKIPLYENYINLLDRKKKISSRIIKKSIIEQALKNYNFSEKSDTFMGVIEGTENKFKVFIPLDEYKNIDPLNFVKDHNLNSETSLLISEIRKIESGEEELKKNEKLIYDGFVLEVTENFIMGNLKPEDEEERLYLSTKEQQWKILNSMEIVVAIKICEIDLNKV